MMERHEDGSVAPVTMNAFELISKSKGLNLSTLFEKQMVLLFGHFFGLDKVCY